MRVSIPAIRSLLPIEVVSALVDRDYEQVMGLVESGSLPWAWDISVHSKVRREVRVFRGSVLNLLGESPVRDEDVYAGAVPNRTIRTSELPRIFSCAPNHVWALIQAGLIPASKKLKTRGPGSYAKIRPEDVIAFLRARRIV